MKSSSGFAKVPVWLLALKPPAHAVLVYAVLYLHGDWETGAVTISHSDLAADSGVSLAQVKRMLVWLRDNDAVTWETQTDGPNRLPNLYSVTVDKPLALSERGGLTERQGGSDRATYHSTDDCFNRGSRKRQPVENWAGGEDAYASLNGVSA